MNNPHDTLEEAHRTTNLHLEEARNKKQVSHSSTKICPICKKEFPVPPYRLSIAKFCSYKCMGIGQKGKVPWNKDRTGVYSEVQLKKMSDAMKGKFMGSKHPLWKSGKYSHTGGYICVHMPEHPHSRDNYIFEHRLVMEKHLGRYLSRDEFVHHINGNKTDNRIENLQLVDNAGHRKIHNGYKFIDGIWWKLCKRCNHIKQVTPENFYITKNCASTLCKTCHKEYSYEQQKKRRLQSEGNDIVTEMVEIRGKKFANYSLRKG